MPPYAQAIVAAKFKQQRKQEKDMDNENYLGCTRPMTDRLKARIDAARMWGDLIPKGEDKHLATVNFECGAMWGEKSTIADACEWIKANIGRYTNENVDTERMCKDLMVQMQ